MICFFFLCFSVVGGLEIKIFFLGGGFFWVNSVFPGDFSVLYFLYCPFSSFFVLFPRSKKDEKDEKDVEDEKGQGVFLGRRGGTVHICCVGIRP